MSFDLNAISSALNEPNRTLSGVDFSGKSLKLDTEQDGMKYIQFSYRYHLYIMLFYITYINNCVI